MFVPLHDDNALRNIRLQYVTLAIIAVNTLIWLYLKTPALNDPSVAQAAAFSFGYIPSVAGNLKTLPAELIVLPTWTSYFTYAFMHADFMHLAGNMLFLWVFGDNVEDAVGHLRFLILYALSAAAGAFVHGLMLPQSDSPLIGASAAVAGVVGAYVMLHPHVRVWVLALGSFPLRLKALWLIGGWLAYQLWMMFFSAESQISWASHIGGVTAGVVLIVFLRKSHVPLFDRHLAAAVPSTEDRTTEKPKRADPGRWGRNP